MNLLEFEGKELLKEFNIAVPQGNLITSPEQLELMSYPLVLKSQVPIGGRGKCGGVKKAENMEDAKNIYEHLSRLEIKGYLPQAILAEETVDIEQELYVSLSIDRKNRSELMLFCAAGGMNIEEIGREFITSISINPLLGLQEYQLKNLFFKTNSDDETKKSIAAMVRRLYGLFKARQLELLEINPLVLTSKGDLVCLDAKIVVDDNFYYKKKQPEHTAQNSFEEATHALGVNGVNLDGDIALITSGAGAGLATIDEISSHKGSIRAFVDLGSLVYDAEKMIKIITMVNALSPKALLFNFFLQVASCDVLAEAIVNSLQGIPVVVRARGKHEEAAASLLRQHGCYVTADLNEAVLKAIELVSVGGK